jgi:hypothetical protein
MRGRRGVAQTGRPMQIRLATSLTAAAVLMCSLATTARPAAAAVITFEFTGTSNTFGREVFGENGELVPYSYSLIYETSLAAQTDFIPAGSGVRHDFYGYSAAGIVACNLTFGNSTWTPDGITPPPIAGHIADFWVDTDLTANAPTRIFMHFFEHDDVDHDASPRASVVAVRRQRSAGSRRAPSNVEEKIVRVTLSAGSMAPELTNESFGALIESTQPIVVERSVYSNANGVTWAAGTNATATRLP